MQTPLASIAPHTLSAHSACTCVSDGGQEVREEGHEEGREEEGREEGQEEGGEEEGAEEEEGPAGEN